MNVCQFCGCIDKYENMNQMKKIYDNDSSFVYCNDCWNNCNNELKCEKCKKKYQMYTCSKNNDFIYICDDCKCDGVLCEYCD
jgi:hypothetical protein